MLPACHSGHDHEEEGHDHGNEAQEEHGDHEEGAEEAHLSEAQFQSLEMKVGPLPERNLGAYIEANGQLEVPPQNEALVSTYIGANVVSIEVIEGDKVSQGKVLAYLSHPDIIQLQTDYLSAYNSLTYLEKDYLRQKKLYEENVGSGKDLQRLEAEFLSARGKSNGYEAQLKLLGLSVDEIKAGYEILKSLGIRSRGVNIISCPSCARQAFPVIETVRILEKKLAHIKKPINLSIIGCVVNGPGEAAQTEIGLTGGGQDNNLLYLSGVPHSKVPSSDIIDRVVKLVEEKTKDI